MTCCSRCWTAACAMPSIAVRPARTSSSPASQAGAGPRTASVRHSPENPTLTATPAITARAGPGAAAYPRAIQTWNGTRPTLTANPASSSTCAVVRAAPAGTEPKLASASDPDLSASSSRPASSAAPLTLPNANVTRAAAGRPERSRSNPASRENATVTDSQANSSVNASVAMSTTATAPRHSAYPAPRPRRTGPVCAAQLANARDTIVAAPNAISRNSPESRSAASPPVPAPRSQPCPAPSSPPAVVAGAPPPAPAAPPTRPTRRRPAGTAPPAARPPAPPAPAAPAPAPGAPAAPRPSGPAAPRPRAARALRPAPTSIPSPPSPPGAIAGPRGRRPRRGTPGQPAGRQQDAVQDAERVRRRARHPHVDREDAARPAAGAITAAVQPAAHRVGADSHDQFRLRHRLMRPPQRPGHPRGAGPGHQQDVGMPGARGEEHAQPVHVVGRVQQRQDLPFLRAVRPGIHVPEVHAAAQGSSAPAQPGPCLGKALGGFRHLGNDQRLPGRRGDAGPGRPGEQVRPLRDAPAALHAPSLVKPDRQAA